MDISDAEFTVSDFKALKQLHTFLFCYGFTLQNSCGSWYYAKTCFCRYFLKLIVRKCLIMLGSETLS